LPGIESPLGVGAEFERVKPKKNHSDVKGVFKNPLREINFQNNGTGAGTSGYWLLTCRFVEPRRTPRKFVNVPGPGAVEGLGVGDTIRVASAMRVRELVKLPCGCDKSIDVCRYIRRRVHISEDKR
jgi:hypothetical protein